MAQIMTLQAYIRTVPDLNLDQNTDYPECVRDFTHSFHIITGIGNISSLKLFKM
jgi:hypothetical protein